MTASLVQATISTSRPFALEIQKPRLQLMKPGFWVLHDAFAFGFGDGGSDAVAGHRFEGARRNFHFDKAAFFGNPNAFCLQVGQLAVLGVAHRVRHQVASERLFAGNFTTSGHSNFSPGA